MSSVLSNLKPALLWKYFDEIRKIPHCSRNEGPLGEYVISVAESLGYTAKKDGAGNIVIEKPATPGNEKSKTVVLQGHLDMVCEKNSDVQHDFTKDPIDVQLDGEWVTAKGTTLGADNGIGVAAGLAILEDDSIVHGPLEILLTVDEETGLNGAAALESDFLKGRILLNLDSEEEGAFSIGCAGGGDSEITLPVKRASEAKGSVQKIGISGLRGGHSGIDIHTGRGNAIQLLARMLFDIDVPFQLIDLEGGSKHNAIPREAFAHIVVQDDKKADLKKALQDRFEQIRFEYKAVEKDMKLTVEDSADEVASSLDEDSKTRFLGLVVGIPHGVMAMSQEIENLVETSNNLAIVRCKESEMSVYTSTRSSILSALEAIRKKIEAVATLAGGKTKHLEGYPPWTPNLDSAILKTMKEVYKNVSGKDAEVMAIHAGLECGIIGEKFPGMDMISFGPDLQNPHSPDERIHSGSVERFYDLVAATLKILV